jgi:hypothetical protein
MRYDPDRPAEAAAWVSRWRIDQPIDRREEIFRVRGEKSGGGFEFSPDAGHVVLEPVAWGQTILLEVETGQTWNIGGEQSVPAGIAWRRDGSSAFFVLNPVEPQMGGITGVPTGAEFVLVDTATGRTTRRLRPDDRSGEFPPYHLDPRWTADGRYVIDTSGWAGCRLIKPKSGKEIDLTETLVERAKLNDRTGPPELHPLSVAGWLWTRRGDRKSYAMDYQARHFIEIADEWEWALTPDGKRVVELGLYGRVTVHPLELPELPAAEPGAGMQAPSPGEVQKVGPAGR